jgi:hypothetical protein
MVGEALVAAGLVTKTGTPFTDGLIKLVGKNLVSQFIKEFGSQVPVVVWGLLPSSQQHPLGSRRLCLQDSPVS